MFLIGLTGGIATGKSSISKLFHDQGIPVIDADLIARQVVEPGKPAWAKIKKEFGDAVFKETGELDRDALGKIIFDNADKRCVLNQITHPEIHRTIYKEIIKCFFVGHNFVVLDLPLLFETGVMLDYLHKIITVTCEEDIQLARLMDRSKLSEADAKKRIQAQMPLEKKCEQSNFVIENSGSMQDAEDQFRNILSILQDSNHHWKIRGVILAAAAVLFSGIAWLINHKYKIYGDNS